MYGYQCFQNQTEMLSWTSCTGTDGLSSADTYIELGVNKTGQKQVELENNRSTIELD